MSDTQPTIEQLRARADDAARLEKENADQARRIAFLESGADLSNPMVRFAYENYSGDAKPEAVQTFLDGLGIRPASPAPSTQTPTQGGGNTMASTNLADLSTNGAPVNLDFQQQRQRLANDAVPGGAPPDRVMTDPYDAALLNLKAGIQSGKDPDMLRAEGVAAIMGAAKLGDPRVLVKQGSSGYADPRTYT